MKTYYITVVNNITHEVVALKTPVEGKDEEDAFHRLVTEILNEEYGDDETLRSVESMRHIYELAQFSYDPDFITIDGNRKRPAGIRFSKLGKFKQQRLESKTPQTARTVKGCKGCNQPNEEK